MFRTALKPRWLALLAVVIAIIVGFTMLGLWQMNVARSSDEQDAATVALATPPVELTQVARPHTLLDASSSGRMVNASGRYDSTKQFLVGPRQLDGRQGWWVVTPLVVDSTGALLPVLRGLVTDPAVVPPAPTGVVTVTGMLAPGESPPDRTVETPSGRMTKLNLAALVNSWTEDLYSGFVFATAESPAPNLGPMLRVPPPHFGSGGIGWRNLAYALQWWLFAAFAVFMWWRMVRDDYRSSQPQLAEAEPPVDPAELVQPTKGSSL